MRASSGVRLSACVAALSNAILAQLKRVYEAEISQVIKSHLQWRTWANLDLYKSWQRVHLLIAVWGEQCEGMQARGGTC